jgi:hypothetical protein
MAGGPVARGVGAIGGRAAGRLAATGLTAAGLTMDPLGSEAQAGPITRLAAGLQKYFTSKD